MLSLEASALTVCMLLAVPERHRVSMLWLEWVGETGTFIPYQPRGSVACRPFPFPLPMPGMANVK